MLRNVRAPRLFFCFWRFAGEAPDGEALAVRGALGAGRWALGAGRGARCVVRAGARAVRAVRGARWSALGAVSAAR